MKETPLPQKPEFLIAVQTPEELVIKFDLPGTKPVIKMILIGVFLLGIGLTLAIPFSHFYGWSLDGLALAASIALPAFWGVDLVFFFF